MGKNLIRMPAGDDELVPDKGSASVLLQYGQMARLRGYDFASQAWLVVAVMDASNDAESEVS